MILGRGRTAHVGPCLLILVAGLVPWHACPSFAGGQARTGNHPCDQVVSFFTSTYRTAQHATHQWRLFDPVRGRDELFLTSRAPFGGLRWDSTFSTVYYESNDSLYRVHWQLGERPVVVGPMPEHADRSSWWFNPDSACWQMLRILGASEGEGPDPGRLFGELWQSSADARHWRMVRRDSLDCMDEHCEDLSWSDGPVGRKANMPSLEDLKLESTVEARESDAVPFDTAAVRVVETEGRWFYLPLDSLHHGVACLLDPYDHQASDPYFLVDLDHHRMIPIDVGRTEIDHYGYGLFSLRCGRLLLPGPEGRASVADARSGRLVYSNNRSYEAAWVPAPRPRHGRPTGRSR